MLKGEKVELRPLKRSDTAYMVRWANDAEVQRNAGLYLPMTEARAEKYIEESESAAHIVEFVIDAIDGETVKPIGSLGFGITWKDARADFGITIGEKDAWNRGYGTEATWLLLRYGFEQLNLHRIASTVYTFNERSLRLHRKLGFVEEGRKRKTWYVDGQYYDEVMFSLLRSEWETMKGDP